MAALASLAWTWSRAWLERKFRKKVCNCKIFAEVSLNLYLGRGPGGEVARDVLPEAGPRHGGVPGAVQVQAAPSLGLRHRARTLVNIQLVPAHNKNNSTQSTLI